MFSSILADMTLLISASPRLTRIVSLGSPMLSVAALRVMLNGTSFGRFVAVVVPGSLTVVERLTDEATALHPAARTENLSTTASKSNSEPRTALGVALRALPRNFTDILPAAIRSTSPTFSI